MESLKRQCDDVGKTFYVHRMNFVNAASNLGDPLWEFNAIFEVASELLMQGADRASLLLYVGPQDSKFDCFAAFVGMLPFRGVSVALLSQVSVVLLFLRSCTRVFTFCLFTVVNGFLLYSRA